ncbi:MAG: HlyD family efflux transporter periplasmic adaptor subunit [Hyphomicrobium sp.]|nr:HlyD family efflux transporter periplasmic adaptor subunit [Hyphomicrobium sp.]
MLRSIVFFVLTMLWATFALAGPGHDHGGGGHGDETAAPAADVPRIESAGSDIELVATAEGHKLTIYLDTIDTNEPVDGALIEVSGDGIAAAVATRSASGTYELEADWVDMPGAKPLVFAVTAGDMSDLLNGTLTIPEAVAPKQTSETLLSLMTRYEVLVAIGVALVLGFCLAVALRPRTGGSTGIKDADTEAAATAKAMRVFTAAAEIILIAVLAGSILPLPASAGPGHDHGDGGHELAATTSGNAPRKLPDGSVFVPKPSQRLLEVRTRPITAGRFARTHELVGTIIPDPSSFGQVQAPMDGQIDVSERGISFAGQNVAAGEVLAFLTPTIPLADLGTMQQLRAEVDGKLIIAEQKLARLTRIAGVIAQRDIDDTQAERDALREQKRVLASKGVDKIPLKAPVSGVISVANVRAGQVVSARDTLFEIVDPKRLWVEGIGSSIHSDTEIAAANAVDADGHTVKLSYIGRSPTLRQQSQPFLFRIDGTHAGLAIGAPVKILVQTPATVEGLVVPDAAIVRGINGLPQVWVKISAEQFKPVAVRVSPIDGEATLILAGLEAGARVVTGGAELINQIR